MQDRIFLDSNILVYCYSFSDVQKQQVARELTWKNSLTTIISTQVLQEFCNVMGRKYAIPYAEIQQVLRRLSASLYVYDNTSTTIDRACAIAHRYGFSFYDSMIVAAAEECKCRTIYSEDLQHEQKINDMIIINPFKK
jgi:predicted nucleic acid-binding protein